MGTGNTEESIFLLLEKDRRGFKWKHHLLLAA